MPVELLDKLVLFKEKYQSLISKKRLNTLRGALADYAETELKLEASMSDLECVPIYEEGHWLI